MFVGGELGLKIRWERDSNQVKRDEILSTIPGVMGW